MSGDEDLYLNQSEAVSEAEALFLSDALLGNADELDFETFGDASGLDDGTFNGITGSGLTSFETRDIFKSTPLNGDSFVEEVEAKCEPSAATQQEVTGNSGGGGVAYANGASHSNYVFNKPTLDLENMGMAYGISGLYLQGNGVSGMGSASSPTVSMSTQTSLISPSEKMNGLTLGQMTPTSYCPPPKATPSLGYSPGMPSRVMSKTNQFMSSAPTNPVAQVVATHPPPPSPASNGLSRFGSQEILMAAAGENGVLSCVKQSTSPVLSPTSSDGNDHVAYTLQLQGSGVDATDFGDQVDGDGDGLQPLPQMTRSSMQRSFSSHALGQLRHMGPAISSPESGMSSRHSQVDLSGGLTSPGARLQPSLAEFQSMGMRPMSVGMRRVYSAGDIQTLNGMQGGSGGGGGASPSFDDGNYRVGKYSIEERKIRIHRYQQKRTQRNFNKKIKYACRKTLADSRPRVRGRFAKNMDDDVPVAALGRKLEDDDDDEGDVHVGEGANGLYHFDNSSGEYSDMLASIKFEHQRVNSM